MGVYINTMIDECSICLDALNENDVLTNYRQLNCGHKFHDKCIYEWSTIKNTCPICLGYFDFSASSAKFLRSWIAIELTKLSNLLEQSKKISLIIHIINITLIHADREVKLSQDIYKNMLEKIYEFRNELKYSYSGWIFYKFTNELTLTNNTIPEYGWYEKITNKLNLLINE